MRKLLVNVYHPKLRTYVYLSDYEAAQIKRTGEGVWDYIQRTNPRKARSVLARLDASQADAVVAR